VVRPQVEVRIPPILPSKSGGIRAPKIAQYPSAIAMPSAMPR